MEILDYIKYGLYGLAGIILIWTVAVTIKRMVIKNKEKKASELKQAEGVIEKHGIRYTPDAEIVDDEGNMNISFVKQDVVLQPRKMVVVSRKGEVRPGKYTVLSAYENEEKFNIRIGLYVKEYKHGQEIVLAEGDEICPTSTTIILR